MLWEPENELDNPEQSDTDTDDDENNTAKEVDKVGNELKQQQMSNAPTNITAGISEVLESKTVVVEPVECEYIF